MFEVILPNDAKLSWWLSMIAGVSPLADMQLGLLRTALPVNRYTTLAECLAAECIFPGYARYLPINWTAPILTISNNGLTSPEPPQFSASADSGDIFGLFATNAADDRFYFVARFDESITIGSGVNLFVELNLLLASLLDN